MIENEEKFWNERKTILLAFGKDPGLVSAEIAIWTEMAQNPEILEFLELTKIQFYQAVWEEVFKQTEEA